MPQVPTFDATPALSTPSRRSGAALRKLPVAVVIVAVSGMLATALFDRGVVVADTPPLIPAPPAAALATVAGDPSVPDASTVFRGREVVVEEPMSTF